MKSTRKPATNKAAAKGKTRKGAPVADTELEIERIAAEHGDTGNAAMNFYYTMTYAPAFVRDAILGKLRRAAEKLGLPEFTDEGDPVEQFTRLVNLFEATGDGFTVNDETPEQEARNLYAFMRSRPKHDFITDALVDAVSDAAHAHNIAPPDFGETEGEQIKALTHIFSTVPPIFSLRKSREAKPAHGRKLPNQRREEIVNLTGQSGDELITSLKRDEAHRFATNIVNSIGSETDEVSELMTLCYALTYSDDREGLLIGIEEAVYPSMVKVILAAHSDMAARVSTLREQG